MTDTPLDPRDHLMARQVLTEVVADRAKRGVEGEALRRVALDTAEAMHAGLAELSRARFGSDRSGPGAPR